MSRLVRVAMPKQASDQPAHATTVILGVLLIVLVVFGLPAIIWAAIALAFPTIGLTYWQALALHIAFRAATLHLQPVRAKKVAQ